MSRTDPKRRMADAVLPLRVQTKEGHTYVSVVDAEGYFVLLIEPKQIRDIVRMLTLAAVADTP